MFHDNAVDVQDMAAACSRTGLVRVFQQVIGGMAADVEEQPHIGHVNMVLDGGRRLVRHELTKDEFLMPGNHTIFTTIPIAEQ